MKRISILILFLLPFMHSFAQWTDTASLNTYIRNNIRDKRPERVTAQQLQTAMLATTSFIVDTMKIIDLISKNSKNIFNSNGTIPANTTRQITGPTSRLYLNIRDFTISPEGEDLLGYNKNAFYVSANAIELSSAAMTITSPLSIWTGGNNFFARPTGFLFNNGTHNIEPNGLLTLRSKFDKYYPQLSDTASSLRGALQKGTLTLDLGNSYSGISYCALVAGPFDFSGTYYLQATKLHNETGYDTLPSTILLNPWGGKVAINKESATESLDVAGNIKTTGYIQIESIKILSGTGSPEGTVSANPGSIYTRTDGSAGTTLYIKESGYGLTGWVAK